MYIDYIKINISLSELLIAMNEKDIEKFDNIVTNIKQIAKDETELNNYMNNIADTIYSYLYSIVKGEINKYGVAMDFYTNFIDKTSIDKEIKNYTFCRIVSDYNFDLKNSEKTGIIEQKADEIEDSVIKIRIYEMALSYANLDVNIATISTLLDKIKNVMSGLGI